MFPKARRFRKNLSILLFFLCVELRWIDRSRISLRIGTGLP